MSAVGIDNIFKLANATTDNIFETLEKMNAVLLEAYKHQILPQIFWNCFHFSVNAQQDPLFTKAFKNYVNETQLLAMHTIATPRLNILSLNSGTVCVYITNREYYDLLVRENLVSLLTEDEFLEVQTKNIWELSSLVFEWDFEVTRRIVDGIFNGFHKIEKDQEFRESIGGFDTEWFISRFLHYASMSEEALQKEIFSRVNNSGLFENHGLPYFIDENVQLSILMNMQDRTGEFMQTPANCSELSINQLRQDVFTREWKELVRRFGIKVNKHRAIQTYLETVSSTIDIHNSL